MNNRTDRNSPPGLRRLIVAALIATNGILALALTLSTLSNPGAYAQTAVGGGQYLIAAAKAQGRSTDVLYVLDLPSQTLNAFIPGLPQRNEFQPVEPRDLRKDFGQ